MQRHHSSQFLCLEHIALLQLHHLATFDDLWQYQGAWFEPPNRERGGWSGVNYIELADQAGKLHRFYLKRQEGHLRKNWRHPLSGEPTFVREFNILQFINAHNKKYAEKQVITSELVFFEKRENQSILLTKALDGFISVDHWLKNNTNVPIKMQRKLMQALAENVKNLHRAGVQHRSLYLKHLFVKELETNFEVALIDFEKSRITKLIQFFKWMDLIKLYERSGKLSAKNKLYFLKKYLEVSRLTCWQFRFWKNLNHKGNRRKLLKTT